MMNNGKVLLIVHDNYQNDNYFPLGVGYLAAVLKMYGADVKIWSQDVFHYKNEDIAKILQKEHYDLIGIGFMAARFNETVYPLCQVINHYKKDNWLVLGGFGPSAIPDYMLKKTNADIVAIGESEETIIELLKCKLESGDLSKVKGIAYRQGSEVFINERHKVVRDLDTLPYPEWSLFTMDKYTTCYQLSGMENYEKAIAIVTSRGCISRCTFCYRMEKGLRFRKLENVIEEIRFLIDNYGVTYFLISDELFGYPKRRIFEFHEELEKNDLKIKFYSQARVDIVDEEILEVLKESGCQWLNYGFESMDQNVLDLMHKNITVEQNIEAAELTRKSGIGMGINFLWGNPGDTEESLRKNVDFIKKYNTYVQLRTIRPVTPYPGCELYYDAITRGLLSGPEDFFAKFKNSDLMVVNYTNIPEDKFYKLLIEANKELIMDHYMNTTKNLETANEMIQGFHDLYFKNDISFRGARHYTKENETK